jgi:hypothetical protein
MMSDYSDEALDRACEAVMRKPGFEQKLQEAAEMFLALADGQDLSDFKRVAARTLLESAIRSTGNKSRGARKIHIHRNSVERILDAEL